MRFYSRSEPLLSLRHYTARLSHCMDIFLHTTFCASSLLNSLVAPLVTVLVASLHSFFIHTRKGKEILRNWCLVFEFNFQKSIGCSCQSPSLVVSSFTPAPFAPVIFVSRVRFGYLISCQPAHSDAYLRDFTLFLSKVSIRTVMHHHWPSPEFIRSDNCVPVTSTTENPPAKGQWPVVKTTRLTGADYLGNSMDHLTLALFSHTH